MRARLGQTRVRLAAAYAIVFSLVAAVGAGVLWTALQAGEYSALDGTIAAQARSLASGIDSVRGKVTFGGLDALPGETAQGISVAALLLAPDGSVLDRSTRAPDPALVRGIVQESVTRGAAVTATATLGGARMRLMADPVSLGNGTTGTLVLTRPLAELDQTLTRAALLLAVGVGILALVASLIGYWLAGRALRPVRVMAATARDISEHDLHRRLTLDLPPDELGELAATFNAMLARLDASFASLRRFTADAAHELRAPLAVLRAEVEVTLQRPRAAAEYRDALRSVLGEAERLSRLADQLLLLARADAGALQPHFTAVDLPDLLEETLSRWRPLAARKRLVLESDVPAVATVQGDADLLRRLVDNLLDNAIRHTPTDGVVRATCTTDDTSWRLAVEDEGPGIEPSLRPVVFERFTKGDPARRRESGGAGLGLSLCAIVARLHGGTIRIEDGAGGARLVAELARQPVAVTSGV